MTRGTLEPGRSGVYAAPAQLATLMAAAERAGLAQLTVDLTGVAGKSPFLARCAGGLGFPETFGGNWDALADCLQDLSWRPALGYVVRFANCREFAARAPGDFAQAIEILEDASIYWRDQGKAFIVLIEGVPALPAFD